MNKPDMAGRKQDRRRREEAATAPQAGRAAPVSARGFTRREALAILALGLLVAASYYPAVFGGFVWDDFLFTESEATRNLWNIWFAPGALLHESHYWPLVYTSFWLEHKLWGLDPTGYHVVNVLLHFANTALLWRLAVRLDVPGAWLIAAVFAVHPLHVESVAWMFGRKDLLSALFYLAAFLVWTRCAQAPRAGSGPYLLVLALFVAGMFSKSIVVTLPAALAIWHWWKQGRVTGEDLLRLVPFLAVGLVITVADVAFYRSREAISFDYSIPERVLLAARALGFYLGKLLWPVELAGIYPHWDVRLADPLGWGCVLAAAAMVAALWRFQHRLGRGPLAGVLFYAVTLAPVLGFVDYGYMQFSFVADRYQYLAGIGVLAVLIGAAVHGAGRLPAAGRWTAAAAALVAVVVLGALTWKQTGIYRDNVTFFTHVIAHNPQARHAHYNLGDALLKKERPVEALAVLRTALEQEPDNARAQSDTGRALMDLNRLEEAEAHLRRALRLDPERVAALRNLAWLLLKQQRNAEALALYQGLIKRNPDNATAHSYMGVALYRLDRIEEALQSLDRALSLDPTIEDARSNRKAIRESLEQSGP